MSVQYILLGTEILTRLLSFVFVPCPLRTLWPRAVVFRVLEKAACASVRCTCPFVYSYVQAGEREEDVPLNFGEAGAFLLGAFHHV